jgi:hypothetical protein
MAESRESSGLLSLVALRQHEAERSQRQAEEARAQAEAEQRARLASERERAREVERRAASERDRQHSAEEAHRVELSELERARSAEFERAEREARARRDLEMCLIEERNARRQAEILLLARAARARSVNLLTGAVCLVTWLGATGAYLGVLRPEADRSRSELDRALAAEQRTESDAQASAARANQRQALLAERVSSLEQAVRDARARATNLPTGAAGKHGSLPAAPAAPHDVTAHGPCQDDGDPLNPCLGPRPSSPKRGHS